MHNLNSTADMQKINLNTLSYNSQRKKTHVQDCLEK